MTQNTQERQLQTLLEMKHLMQKSTRFMSLSGLSGVAAGVIALLGAAVAFHYIGSTPFETKRSYLILNYATPKWGLSPTAFFLINGISVFILALLAAIFFTVRKAKHQKQAVWGPLTWRLLRNIAVPLGAGGLFSLALLHHGVSGLVASTTLIFYGLALFTAGKYTLKDIQYLGLSQIALGLIAAFYVGYGLEFWSIGFGLFHILYGTIMYYKYDYRQ